MAIKRFHKYIPVVPYKSSCYENSGDHEYQHRYQKWDDYMKCNGEYLVKGQRLIQHQLHYLNIENIDKSAVFISQTNIMSNTHPIDDIPENSFDFRFKT